MDWFSITLEKIQATEWDEYEEPTPRLPSLIGSPLISEKNFGSNFGIPVNIIDIQIYYMDWLLIPLEAIQAIEWDEYEERTSCLPSVIEREGMEGTEVEARDKDRKLQIAVRRAKAALLLSSLKSSVNRVFEAANNDECETQVKEKMRREIESQRVELVKERLKMKKIKFCGMVDLILQVILVMLISSFFMKLALDFFIFDDESFFCYSAT
ncbi:hypothetical protein PVK06_015905 [Gossypium arboreum]|uniref:Uncharacterized protein n=6 Tax=Gossypium TaxID=3633 RepID=A0ABR0PYI2_GOSAR|nr:hypothetical protein PVK06_015905 [Gossypium arboreum]